MSERPKEVQPSVTEIIKNSEYWNKRRLNFLGDDYYFDQEIRTGVCYLCKRDGRKQKSEKTELHHLRYDQTDKLSWTIEVCGSCHWFIDPKKRESLERKTGKHIPIPHKGGYYLNKKQRKKKEEQDKRDWFMSYCMRQGSEFVPVKHLIPNQEFYDNVVEAIKKYKTDSRKEKMGLKKEPMSDVSKRYS